MRSNDMKTEDNASAQRNRRTRDEWLGGLGAEFILQLTLLGAIVTALGGTIATLGAGTIA
jgi:hypothetical protein